MVAGDISEYMEGTVDCWVPAIDLIFQSFTRPYITRSQLPSSIVEDIQHNNLKLASILFLPPIVWVYLILLEGNHEKARKTYILQAFVEYFLITSGG